jgi:hypothetical protein
MPDFDPPAVLPHQVLVDPTGRRRRRLAIAGRVATTALGLWLVVLILGGLGLQPLAGLPILGHLGAREAAPPALPERVQAAVARGATVAPARRTVQTPVGTAPVPSPRPTVKAPSRAKTRPSAPAPARTKTAPGHALTAPAPAASLTTTSPSSTAPGQTRTPPGQTKTGTSPSSTAPGQTRTAPGQTKTGPGPPTTTPGITPGANGNAHGAKGTVRTP